MIITLIKWHDAMAHEAAGMEATAAVPELAVLTEVGFLLAENERIVTIGMETQEGTITAGRWRLNIPKNAIIERRDTTVRKAFAPPRKRKPKAVVESTV